MFFGGGAVGNIIGESNLVKCQRINSENVTFPRRADLFSGIFSYQWSNYARVILEEEIKGLRPCIVAVFW
jgi:hypothetical protein